MIIRQFYIKLFRPRDTGEGKDCLWYGTTFCDGDLIEVRAKYDICKNLSKSSTIQGSEEVVVSHALLRGRHEGGQQGMGRCGQADQETLTQ